jgi:hypothetical protein
MERDLDSEIQSEVWSYERDGKVFVTGSGAYAEKNGVNLKRIHVTYKKPKND